MTWAPSARYADEWFADAERRAPPPASSKRCACVKDDGELARIEAAAAVADAALAEVRHRLLDGPTEAEFALELDTAMRRLGAAGPSFETIVGVRSQRGPAPRPAVGAGASPRATWW